MNNNSKRFRVPMKAKSEEKEGVAFRIDGVMTFYIKYFDNCFKEIIKQDDFR